MYENSELHFNALKNKRHIEELELNPYWTEL
jgi:hypothetical protein